MTVVLAGSSLGAISKQYQTDLRDSLVSLFEVTKGQAEVDKLKADTLKWTEDGPLSVRK